MSDATEAKKANARLRHLWVDWIFARRDLTSGEKVLAACIARHRNDLTGRCFPSEETLAYKTGQSSRNVRKLKASLKEKGAIDWEDVPGIASEYVLQINQNFYEFINRPPRNGRSRVATHPGKGVPAHPGTGGPTPRHAEVVDPGTSVPANLKENLNKNLGGGGDALENVVNSGDKKEGTNEERWRRIYDRLRLKIGDGAFEEVEEASLSFDRITGRTDSRTVWLAARGSFEAEKIHKAIGGVLLECWQAELPSITCVKVLTRGLDAADSRRAAAAAQ